MPDINQPPAPPPALPPPAVVAPPDSSMVQTGRELLTAVISLVILVASMWAFGLTFAAGREAFTDTEPEKKAASDRQKDLLGLAIGLLGTVTGYYLGRVPAELRAQTAQGMVNTASAAAAQANQNTEDVKRDARASAEAALAALHAQPTEARSREVGGRNETEVTRLDVSKARQPLEQLLRRL